MSQPPSWEEIKNLFAAVQEIAPEVRTKYLDEVCAGSPELRAELESLLEWDEGASRFLNTERTPGADLSGALTDAAPDIPDGQAIGAYRVTGRIGQGGMGTVYRAVRADEAFEKVVAIKVIRRGFGLGHIVRRFHQERQALAALDHPNIARLIDGGRTEDGLPYFVMEYVEGLPIDRYCDEHHQAIERRLELFRDVCAAVEYAHQNLIVHRDIKPDNILVTADGVPKLLDFGIAKLLKQAEAGVPSEERAATRLMTPDYASPEQIEGKPVTTATDVYSLGVLLYRLLAGRRPYDVTDATPLEAARVICDTQPVPPSVAAATPPAPSRAGSRGLMASVEELSSQRATTPRGLRRRLAGDLDTIVAMAMRKEPDRRYRSVDQFSDDIRRHLVGLPVIARKDTFRYRTGKFIRRHKAAVALGAALALTLVASTIVTAWQARVADRERDRARTEAAKAAGVTTFLQDMLASAAPGVKGRDVRVADVLDAASSRTSGSLDNQPDTKAAILTTIGKSYLALGLYDAAESHLKQAIAIRDSAADPDPHEQGVSVEALGTVYLEQGKLDSAGPLLERALDLYRRAHGPEHVTVASVLNRLGSMYQSQGRADDAERAQRASLEMRRKLLGNMHIDVSDSLNDLGVVLGTKGDFKSALPMHEEALTIARHVHGAVHTEVAATMMNLAFAREMTGDLDGAEPLYRDALAMRRKLLGNEHPETAWTMYSYAAMLEERGNLDLAESLCREILALRGKTLPDTHPMIMGAMHVLGRTVAVRDPAAAEPIMRECLVLRRQALGPDHWLVRSTESVLGGILASLGRRAEAQLLLTRSHEALRQRFGDDDERTRQAKERLEKLNW